VNMDSCSIQNETPFVRPAVDLVAMTENYESCKKACKALRQGYETASADRQLLYRALAALVNVQKGLPIIQHNHIAVTRRSAMEVAEKLLAEIQIG